ncbi:Uncharacterised protein [Citrobacter freundii]|nr:Uncharacterised protein [Citrobacter freundii]
MDVQSARTVAFEVGLQNGGMASGLAAAMGKLATVGLASGGDDSAWQRQRLAARKLLAQKRRQTGTGRRRQRSRSTRLRKSVKRIITMTTLTLGHALRAVTSALELAETCYVKRPLSVGRMRRQWRTTELCADG